ncbi:uncharacterized protein PHACADRAFT_253098 [Phanerochaete carnosa HHB-10118-sp]|uniref:Uncharacterized protein n=1 Tax=Phanerochaete carnosa (strain HHB-10118-sp) TaxID=650164 RepID=K5WHM9_PHACS|nr:uncharacterized protein PHACADRAFT_253098 [Phanerochaete carnosa HHB-10118-sp]EKM58629.1 hypothetical protein PHACADRAFT_253098 [Phanerochaete carnosa HHB-10118-sp]
MLLKRKRETDAQHSNTALVVLCSNTALLHYAGIYLQGLGPALLGNRYMQRQGQKVLGKKDVLVCAESLGIFGGSLIPGPLSNSYPRLLTNGGRLWWGCSLCNY